MVEEGFCIMQIIRDDEYAAVVYCPDTKCVQVRWNNGEGPGQREVFDQILQLIQERPTFTYIADIREQGVVSDVSRGWMETELLPVAIMSGLKKVAVVVEEEIFKQFFRQPAHPPLTQSPQYLEFRYMYSLEEAQTWATEVYNYYDGRVSHVA
ncbi:MAG TPA: hypothetical protein DCE41_20780 [Cytophagales bacterium]|nr:hypothetical protein [Cytophagales bacterium]